jgi:hypothetical protein
MSKKLTKNEVERLIAALDDLGEDEADRMARLRAATATALARLIGRDAPWPELIGAAGAIAGWSPDRIRRLTGDGTDPVDAIDTLYDLITELNETRGL